MLLYDLWKENKNDVDIGFRLIGECWMPMADGGCTISISAEEWKIFTKILIETSRYFLKGDYFNAYQLSLVGYMINLFPQYFDLINDLETYKKWERIGHELIVDAYKLCPEDILITRMRYGNVRIISKEHKFLEEIFRPIMRYNIDKYFTPETEIERYFIGIFTSEIKY